MPKNNFKRALLCESRLLYRSAARYSLEENAYSVLEISPHQLLEEACGYNGKDQLIVIGIGGVGSEIRTLLQAIYRLTFFTSNIIVSLPGDNGHLSVFMKGLGVSHIIPEDLLCETLSTYINVASVLPLALSSQTSRIMVCWQEEYLLVNLILCSIFHVG